MLQCFWAWDMTWGMTEQSTRNWQYKGLCGFVKVTKSSATIGWALAYAMVNSESLTRVAAKD